MEVQLISWFFAQREAKACVTGLALQSQARLFYDEIHAQDEVHEFQASAGWLTNFLSRHHLTNRRVSSTGRELPKDTLDSIRSFFRNCNEAFRNANYNRSKILNMDETSIYLDYPSNYTYDQEGKRRILLATTGSERTRLSAAFTAAANGTKLPIFVIVPRANELEGYVPPDNVRVLYKTNSTFNSDVLINEYLPSVMVNQGGSWLLLDSARCHSTNNLGNAMRVQNITRTMIPPSMTNLLQPADVCWLAGIKRAYQVKWNDWFRY